MTTLILRTVAPAIVLMMLVFSVYVLLGGHNRPGGGFIAGLIAAAALALYGMAAGPAHVRRALRVDPLAIAGFGLLLAAVSGLLSFFAGAPFLTGLWFSWGEVTASTPLLFDIGVYCVVLGAMASAVLMLEER